MNAYHDLIVKMKEEEFKASYGGGMLAHWNESDANADGKLDQTEFFAFLTKRKAYEMGEEVGIFWPAGMESHQGMWECVNAVSEGDGAVVSDWWTVMGPWVAKYK